MIRDDESEELTPGPNHRPARPIAEGDSIEAKWLRARHAFQLGQPNAIRELYFLTEELMPIVRAMLERRDREG